MDDNPAPFFYSNIPYARAVQTMISIQFLCHSNFGLPVLLSFYLDEPFYDTYKQVDYPISVRTIWYPYPDNKQRQQNHFDGK